MKWLWCRRGYRGLQGGRGCSPAAGPRHPRTGRHDNAAQEFVRPLTFAALSGEKVITDLFGSAAETPNIDSAVDTFLCAQAIDALVVVPATADLLENSLTLGKRFSDDVISRDHRSRCPRSRHEREHVENAATQANLKILREPRHPRRRT